MPNRIKQLRKKEQLTLRELELKTGIRDVNLSRYERGTVQPKEETWKKLADFFGVPIAYIKGLDTEAELYMQQFKNSMATDSDLMINIDESPNMMILSKTDESRKSAITINRILQLLDSDVLETSTKRPEKSKEVRDIEISLLSQLGKAFENMRGTIQFGLGFSVSKPEKYIQGLHFIQQNLIMLDRYSHLDDKYRNEILQYIDDLENKAQNKKASDD
ncbi:helix-turn-helix transcriptional regulator [Leuconostoc falkenbergense]